MKSETNFGFAPGRDDHPRSQLAHVPEISDEMKTFPQFNLTFTTSNDIDAQSSMSGRRRSIV